MSEPEVLNHFVVVESPSAECSFAVYGTCSTGELAQVTFKVSGGAGGGYRTYTYCPRHRERARQRYGLTGP